MTRTQLEAIATCLNQVTGITIDPDAYQNDSVLEQKILYEVQQNATDTASAAQAFAGAENIDTDANEARTS